MLLFQILIWVSAAIAASDTDNCAGTKRSNFASLECAASIVETNPGVKNSQHVLQKSKDTYAMFACSDPTNYMIVELCQDILIDEVSLANYEFFSSQFKDIKFSASDRYPAEESNWFTLGSFETNNTREDQVFHIESPRVWARYLRADFVSHWDEEYYCPITAIRVHGTTMLDKFKQDDELAEAELAEQRSSHSNYDEDCAVDTPVCPAEHHSFQDLALPELHFENICTVPHQPHPNSLLVCTVPTPKLTLASSTPNQCCIRPASTAPASLPSSSTVFKESLYESIGKRLTTVEASLRSHGEALGEYRESVQTFFDALAANLIQDFDRLAQEKASVESTIDEFRKELANQRTTIYLQTTILVVLIIYLLTPRMFDEHATPFTLQPGSRFSVDSLAQAGSNDEYDNDVEILSDADDTYADLDPHTPSFTPSRPGTPASSVNEDITGKL